MIQEYDEKQPDRDKTRTATFALGCFWGPDEEFGAMDGVIRTRVGYAGGTKNSPTYHDLGDHTEVFQIDYSPKALSYSDLISVFFEKHNPHKQTRKKQYQKILLYENREQLEEVEKHLENEGLDAEDITTRIEKLDRFYLAEDYHQKHSLRSRDSLMRRFEEIGYSEEEIRESPAAAKLNGYASGYDIPRELKETIDL